MRGEHMPMVCFKGVVYDYFGSERCFPPLVKGDA